MMLPKPATPQEMLFDSRLDRLLNPNHPLGRLAQQIEWAEFDRAFGALYSPDQGCPAKPTRLMVGLPYLKHAYDLSDEAVVEHWVENPY